MFRYLDCWCLSLKPVANSCENRRLFGPDYRMILFSCCEIRSELPQARFGHGQSMPDRKRVEGYIASHAAPQPRQPIALAGVPLPTLSKRLGHSSLYFTATVYSHALGKDEVAAQRTLARRRYRVPSRPIGRRNFSEQQRSLARGKLCEVMATEEENMVALTGVEPESTHPMWSDLGVSS